MVDSGYYREHIYVLLFLIIFSIFQWFQWIRYKKKIDHEKTTFGSSDTEESKKIPIYLHAASIYILWLCMLDPHGVYGILPEFIASVILNGISLVFWTFSITFYSYTITIPLFKICNNLKPSEIQTIKQYQNRSKFIKIALFYILGPLNLVINILYFFWNGIERNSGLSKIFLPIIFILFQLCYIVSTFPLIDLINKIGKLFPHVKHGSNNVTVIHPAPMELKTTTTTDNQTLESTNLQIVPSSSTAEIMPNNNINDKKQEKERLTILYNNMKWALVLMIVSFINNFFWFYPFLEFYNYEDFKMTSSQPDNYDPNGAMIRNKISFLIVFYLNYRINN